MRSSSEKVRPWRWRRAWARKAAPNGSILRLTAGDRELIARKWGVPSSDWKDSAVFKSGIAEIVPESGATVELVVSVRIENVSLGVEVQVGSSILCRYSVEALALWCVIQEGRGTDDVWPQRVVLRFGCLEDSKLFATIPVALVEVPNLFGSWNTTSDRRYEDEVRLDDPVDVDCLIVEVESRNSGTPVGTLV